ncbi:MAG TPA: hypothetical protein VEZ42_14270, partial [Pseudonocardia sp.]|nr:hypothetical protein [Pseudonocardia sp.]
MVTSVYLQTRGRPRHRDYDFLGAAPGHPWWRAYAGHTAFERPTALVESDGEGYRVYLSGIPSARRDAVGTVIRYTLVLEESPDGTPAVRPARVVALVAAWLADRAPGGTGELTRVLDQAFPEPEVERLLAAAGPGAPAEVRSGLAAVVGALPEPDLGTAAGPGGGWLGDAGSAAARAAFLERVRALVVDGRPGRALLLNLVGSAEDLAALRADPRPLAVLVPDLDAPGLVPLDPAVGGAGGGA